MKDSLNQLPYFLQTIKDMSEIILTNIVLNGQIPAPTFGEAKRAEFFIERLTSFQIAECSTDGYGNPLGIIRGTGNDKPPIFLVAHMDTIFDSSTEHNYTVKGKSIMGAGILDNSVGVGVLLSIPEIFKRLNLQFKSDIILTAPIHSIGEGNLQGIHHLVKNWPTPIRGAICLEGGELGRLNYFSDGMIRGEISCNISQSDGWKKSYKPNAILILNEVINQILKIRLPQNPSTEIIISKFSGGMKYGDIAYKATIGFEIHSGSDKMVKEIYRNIQDIVNGIVHEYSAKIELRIISNTHACKLPYNHPLVKAAIAVMKKLKIKHITEHSESELSIFLSHKIPAITLGLTQGKNYHLENAEIEIKPLFKGIAQILGVLIAIDEGVCDE